MSIPYHQYVASKSDTSQSVQCMRCRTVRWFLACFVEMSWELRRATVRWHWVPDWRDHWYS